MTMTSQKLIIVNPNDRNWTKHRYVLAFGLYGQYKHLVWGNNLQDALDESIDWLADNAPGMLANEAVEDMYKQNLADGMNEEKAMEEAEQDITRGGNAGDCLLSWEWYVIVEDPTRQQILQLQGR